MSDYIIYFVEISIPKYVSDLHIFTQKFAMSFCVYHICSNHKCLVVTKYLN